MTVVLGCLARSVRDAARWFDVCNGYDSRDPYSLPRVEGWERDLGTHDLRGKRAVIAPDARRRHRASRGGGNRAGGRRGARPATPDSTRRHSPSQLPGLGFEWALANLSGTLVELGDRWPDCKDDLTHRDRVRSRDRRPQMMNLEIGGGGRAQPRTAANETMAALFDQVDFVIARPTPTSPSRPSSA